MVQCNANHLDYAHQQVQRTLSGNAELVARIAKTYCDLRATFNAAAVDFCLQKYITAEMDFKTPGDRGLGRMSTQVPRLGAYYRNQMSSLSVQDAARLYEVIQDVMLRGYLVHALVLENPLRAPLHRDGSTIYEKWVPGIYAGDPSKMGPNLQEALGAFSHSAFANLKLFFDAHAMSGRGLLAKDKTEMICFFYPVAGLGIRAVEVGMFG